MRKIEHAAKFYGSSVVDLHEFLTLPLPTISTESISNQVLVGGDVFLRRLWLRRKPGLTLYFSPNRSQVSSRSDNLLKCTICLCFEDLQELGVKGPRRKVKIRKNVFKWNWQSFY